jgi:hypothetical protein
VKCPYAYDDAGYVLGALPPDERREFVGHLGECAACRASVRDLAGLPGLLARVEPNDVLSLDLPPEPAPKTLLPRLIAAAQSDQLRARRRRRVMTLAMAACLALIALVGVPLAVAGFNARAGETVETTLSMRPVNGQVPVSAAVGLTDTKWGTKVSLKCSYDKSAAASQQAYGLYAVGKNGKEEPIGSWTVGPGDTVQTLATTQLHRSDLAALEIRRADGRTVVLRTTL